MICKLCSGCQFVSLGALGWTYYYRCVSCGGDRQVVRKPRKRKIKSPA